VRFWVIVALAVISACSRRDAPREPAPPERTLAAPAAEPARHPLARPKTRSSIFAVLTPLARDDARRFASDAGAIDVRDAREWLAPSGDARDRMAERMSRDERAALDKVVTVVIVNDASAAASLATRARGFVYDEVLHRIETARAFATHGPRWDAWRADRVVVVSDPQPDGTARVVTLGMRRFGAPDLAIEGATGDLAAPLGAVLLRVASLVAGGATEAPLAIAPGARVDLIAPEHPHEGDPDNVVLRVVPIGSTYEELAERVSRAGEGADAVVAFRGDGGALATVAERARAALPGAIARWSRERDAGASLLVKLPFGDAGSVEWMWVEVDRADATRVEGALASTPVRVAGLHAGSRIDASRTNVADYAIEWPDGGREGGESERLLGRE
jgi:hypothetical protein